MFFAPGILFFAISGTFQTLGLHESGAGKQPALPFIGVLASVHKEGEVALPKPRTSPLIAPVNRAGSPPKAAHDATFPPFKVYALLLSFSLIVSMALGIAVALANPAARRRTWALLAAGCVVPLVLLIV